MTQDAMLARAAALLAQTLEDHETCDYVHDCDCPEAMPKRLELDILAWLDAARALGKREG